MPVANGTSWRCRHSIVFVTHVFPDVVILLAALVKSVQYFRP
jgi:hypothetical protein